MVVQRIKTPIFAPGHAAIVEVGAVGNDTLVLHPQVRGLYNTIFINAERVTSNFS